MIRARGHSQAILSKFAESNYRLNFFTVSAINLWNKLSDDDVRAPSLSNFKVALSEFFKQQDIW